MTSQIIMLTTSQCEGFSFHMSTCSLYFSTGDVDNSYILKVGWADPKVFRDGDIVDKNIEHTLRFNFHITLDGYNWRETHEYSILASLDSAITANNEDFLHVQFPDLSDIQEFNKVLRILQNDVEFNTEGIRVLERHRVVMQRWANILFNRMTFLDDDCRQVLKQLFFRSPEKMLKYEKIYGHSAQKKSSRPLDVNFLAVPILGSAATVVAAAPSSSGARLTRPRASSDTEDTPLIRRLSIHDPPDAGRGGRLTIAALQSQQKQLDNKAPPTKRLSMMLGFGKKGSRSTRSVDQNSSFIERERGKEKDKIKQKEKESLSEISNNSALLKVAVQRGQETTRNGVLLYEITLKVVGKKYSAPITYCAQQRFKHFKELCTQLYKMDAELARLHLSKRNAQPSSDSSLSGVATGYERFMDAISAEFPSGMKAFLGISLNDSDLSERTRRLDAWLRDVLFNYRSMPAAAKQLVRNFLKFDMSRPIDIFMQDQLSWGLIEAPRGDKPVLIVQKSALSAMSNDMMEQLETMSSDSRTQTSVVSAFNKRADRHHDTTRKSVLNSSTSSVATSSVRQSLQVRDTASTRDSFCGRDTLAAY